MKFKLYSIFDSKSRVFLAPFVSRSDVDAIRQVRASKDDPQLRDSPVGRYPEDFKLVALADFDDETGVISNCAPDDLARVFDIWAEKPSSTVPS